jgi:hypothetical protein
MPTFRRGWADVEVAMLRNNAYGSQSHPPGGGGLTKGSVSINVAVCMSQSHPPGGGGLT